MMIRGFEHSTDSTWVLNSPDSRLFAHSRTAAVDAWLAAFSDSARLAALTGGAGGGGGGSPGPQAARLSATATGKGRRRIETKWRAVTRRLPADILGG